MNQKILNLALFTQGLNTGGAERQLLNLAQGLIKKGHKVIIITYYPGKMDEFVRSLGIPLFVIHPKPRFKILSIMLQLKKIIEDNQIDLIHSYLTIPNIYTGLLKFFIRNIKVVWGVRAGVRDGLDSDLKTRVAFIIQEALSSLCDLIICNSFQGKEFYSQYFNKAKIVSIANGIDTQYFKILNKSAIQFDFINPKQRYIGIVGRLDPVKNHELFIHALVNQWTYLKNFQILCVGRAEGDRKQVLQALLDKQELGKNWIWVDDIKNMPDLYNVLDLVVLSSKSEGFPNVLAESLSCGTPTVSTNVGDAKWIIPYDKWVTPPEDSSALGKAITFALKEPHDKHQLRQHIVDNFSLEKMIEVTETNFYHLLRKTSK